MIIKEFDIVPYKINLRHPFIYANNKISYRQGYILKVIDEMKNSAYGNISPLPGLSQESFNDLSPLLLKLKSLTTSM